MATVKEIIYMVLDELKTVSDDGYFEEDHIKFLMKNYRVFLLKLRYSDIRKEIPTSNYQTLCLDLIQVPAISGEPCEGGMYLRSKEELPAIASLGLVTGFSKVTSQDFWLGEFDFINREKFRYVGDNKYLKNIIYVTLGPDNHLYFKSNNPLFLYLLKVKFNSVFEDYEAASKLTCDSNGCADLDDLFPLETALIPPLIELIIKELLGPLNRKVDDSNNASDDLSK